MRVRIQHRTRYVYEKKAAFGPHYVRLRPADHTRAQLLSYNLDVAPEGAEVRWQQDPWGNRVARLTFPAGHTAGELVLTVDAAFDVRPVNPFDFFVDDRCQQLPFRYPDGLEEELAPFLSTVKPGPLLAQLVAELPPKGYVTDYLVAVNQRVARDINYIIRNEPGIQTSEETLSVRRGSCRDSARLLVEFFRAQGLAARFVSGYLIQLTDEGNIPDLAKGVDSDVVDLHAWCEVFVPGGGWVGLDGTSGLLCNEGHIPLASAVRPELAAPVDGTASEAATGFEFSMNVSRLGHEPRPRKPYTDEQWQALLEAGRETDRIFKSCGLTLTMGGEPTWTSRLHQKKPEWVTEALGETKWAQGIELARELRQRFASGGVVLQRMGKHYPGESLPRWALSLLWREDGEPLWRDGALLDLEHRPATEEAPSAKRAGQFAAEHGVLVEKARALGEAICATLGVPARLEPGYEDPWVAIVRELDFPDDVDPLSANLDDPEERRTLARVLDRGLGAVVGFALPLGRAEDGWATATWSFLRKRLYLLPGDSPMGLRLPLERLGGEPIDLTHPRDVTMVREELPRLQAPLPAPVAKGGELPNNALRTALCIEPRDGALHVFLPPLSSADAFIELLAAIETAASALGQKVRLEGYGPPSDPRLNGMLVAPDPGVLEVNVPVTKSWDAYVEMMGKVADAANHAGLCTEKYQLDGREVGSGGGNHITLGGETAESSPFLRRPGLLASVLRFVQNHPSLSYLFTGIFVGPTSQAPRLDEARHDSLYELELALARAERADEYTHPWLVDRLFRNLLVDVEGNTHRSEICIDKLYSPHGPAGRQGIVELRAFEMPPNEQMAAAQMLLVRGMVAAFARAPYREKLVRFGTDLHDRFMLPHYLWQDLLSVLDALGQRGVRLDPAFYQPFVDYRFPRLGQLTVDDVTVELRPALEPWPVLGEQPTGATVSRYVDSSLERLEVRVFGLTEGRHQVAVNGLALPLVPTGKGTERVVGVRFRAWQPPHCLQPTIGVHHPLRFDVIDTWAKRSLGACTYHVWHPEGRAFEEPPLTAFEAAARRAQRFSTVGHASYPAVPIAATPSNESPYTVDLRRFDVDRRLPALVQVT